MKAFRLLFLASVGSILAPSAGAQTTYDDFNGTAISKARWFRYGKLSNLSQSQGRLRLNGPNDKMDFGVYSVDSLRGDWTLTLHFDSFATSTTTGNPGLGIIAFDAVGPKAPTSEVGVGIRRGPGGLHFLGEAYNRQFSAGFATKATTATAGRVRIARSSGRLVASYLEQGKSKWVVLKTWSDFFVTNQVRFVIAGIAGFAGNVSGNCDKITYTGTRVPGPKHFGPRCHGLGATTLGIPRVGDKSFTLLVSAGPTWFKAPALFTIGSSKTSIDLTPAGAPGCYAHTLPIVVLAAPALDRYGESELPFPIPNDPKLAGIKVILQAAGGGLVNNMGLAWSSGIELEIVK